MQATEFFISNLNNNTSIQPKEKHTKTASGRSWSVGNKIQAVWHTVKYFFHSKVDYTSVHRSNSNNLKIVASMHKKLNTQIVGDYFHELVKSDNKLHFDQTFSGMALTNQNKTNIKSAVEFMKLDDRENETVFIPVIVKGQALFEQQHIVLITVTDDQVEFYDPKGISSNHYSIGKDLTVDDLIKEIKQQSRITSKTIENREKNQKDINNCGVFVCNRAKAIATSEKNLGNFKKGHFSSEEIKAFRSDILNSINKEPEENENYNPGL